jgi:WS/DGAT/MGAT family acyltransferase
MADRLSALDASFLYLENRSTPLHVGGVAVFRKPRSGFDYGQLVSLIEARLPDVPRYRQKVVPVPGHLARPVWVDDPDFDLTFHVRRSALPRPGSAEQLLELVARLMSRPLDHSRPLWEAYLIEGLARSHVALVTKTHQALGDELVRRLLDPSPRLAEPVTGEWHPRRQPGQTQLALAAMRENVLRPQEILATARGLLAVIGERTRPPAAGPLGVRIGGQRRFAVARARLDDLERIGALDEVVLAAVCGALRSWLLSRGEPVTSSSTLRAAFGERVVELPVGEANPVVRLHHIGHALRSGPPPFPNRTVNLVITTVPGPQIPLYAGTLLLTEIFPVMPLVRNQALAIGVTSYDGGVYFGLTGDRDAMSESDTVDTLAGMLEESVDELLTSPRRP